MTTTSAPAAEEQEKGFNPRRRFQSAYAVSALGDQMRAVALPIAVAERTGGDPFAVGAVAAVEFLMLLIVGLLAGVLADRLMPRRMVLVADGVRAALMAGLAIIILAPGWSIALVVAVTVVLGVMRVTYLAAALPLLRAVAPGPEFLKANSRLVSGDHLAAVVGPIVTLVVLKTTGSVALAFLLDAVTFLISMVLLGTLKRADEAFKDRNRKFPTPTQGAAELSTGFKQIFANNPAAAAMIPMMAAYMILYSHIPLLLPYVTQTLELGETGFSLLLALGGVLGFLVAPLAGRVKGIQGRMIVIGLVIASTGVMTAGLVPSVAGAAFAVFSIVVGVTIAATHHAALIGRTFDPSVLGRVGSITRAVLRGSAFASLLAGGALARAYGPPSAFLMLGAIGFIAAAWTLRQPLMKFRME